MYHLFAPGRHRGGARTLEGRARHRDNAVVVQDRDQGLVGGVEQGEVHQRPEREACCIRVKAEGKNWNSPESAPQGPSL